MSKYKISLIVEVDDQERKKQFAKEIESAKSSGVNVETIYVEESASALNQAMKEASGDIICFTQTSCQYSDKAFANVLKRFDKMPDLKLVSVTPYVYDAKKNLVLQLRFQDIYGRIDIAKDEHLWNQFLFSMFIRKDVLTGYSFSEKLKYEYKREFYARLYSEVTEYYLIKDLVMALDKTELDFYNYRPPYFKDWYMEELETIAELLNTDSTLFKQKVLMDFVRLQYACNLNGRDKNILLGEDVDIYENKVKAVLQTLDDDIITMYHDRIRKRLLNRFMSEYFLKLKYGVDKLELKIVDDPSQVDLTDDYESKVFVTDKGTYIENVGKIHAKIKAMNQHEGKLEIDGEVVNMYFEDNDNYDLVARVENNTYPVVKNQIYSLTQFFGRNVKTGWTFWVAVPIKDINKKTKIEFYLQYKGQEYPIAWKFTKPQARLTEEHVHSYWNFNKKLIKYSNENKCLTVERSRWYKTLGSELIYDIAAIKYGDEFSRAYKSVLLRWVYYITKPFYKNKNIWMTFDQLFKGGDNGEYFYRYVSELNNGNQIIYYIVNKDTKEYKELRGKYKTVLHYNCFKHRLITLHTKMILTTRADAILYGGYFSKTAKYFRGLFNCEISCLQHGLTIQQIAQYQNRLFDNLKYYFCVSPYEVENISQPEYGYHDKSILKLTGAPRYDGLKSKPKKQIIITPTWRRNVTAGTNSKGSNHSYSTNFKNTTYYRIYNSLINDPKLIQTAKDCGYKLIYLIHPILSPQVKDFDKNDYVEIVPGSEVNYEEILTESALMLTDHSGIMYDFAYQRKPLVYYHPEELPPQYGEGGLKYETMGFGPVCHTHESVVRELCNLMERDCQLEDMYKERIENFFEFDDYNNCKRCYEAAVEFQNNLKY